MQIDKIIEYITPAIILLYILSNYIIRLIGNKSTNKKDLNLEELINTIIEAEQKLGKGQGKAKLLYVLNKLNYKENNKKVIKKINEVVNTINIISGDKK